MCCMIWSKGLTRRSIIFSRPFREAGNDGRTHDERSQEESTTDDPALPKRIRKRNHNLIFHCSIWQILQSNIVRGGPGHSEFSPISWNFCEASTEVGIQDCGENSQAYQVMFSTDVSTTLNFEATLRKRQWTHQYFPPYSSSRRKHS